MDTHGHHECADQAGLPLLEAALERIGKSGWRTGAFYLGNWITDVQQAVDPQPYSSVANGVRSGVDDLIKSIMSFEVVGQPGWIHDNLGVPLTNFLGRIKAAASALDGGQKSKVAGMMRSAFLVNGYFKFVHPEERGQGARMDYGAFKHVFEKSYTQYYPHEHLDRYPMFDVRAGEQKTRTPEGFGTGSDPLRPHIYDYLINDVQCAAGLLSEIDKSWAKRTFSPNGQPWPKGDANHDWNYQLSRLGHAVHALEDFFAHSNYVEHAMKTKGSPLTDGHAGEVFRKRLTRLHTDGSVGGDETDVVTGYFDSWDTLHSLSHVVQELGLRIEAHRDAAPKPPEVHGNATKVGRLMVELVRRIQKGPRTRAAAEAELVKLAAGDDPSVDAAMRDAAYMVLHKIPPEAAEIKDKFFDTVLALSETIPGSSLTLADGLILIAEFYERLMYPWDFFTWMVTELPPGAARWLVENVADAIEDRIREPFERVVRRVVDDKLNRFRVGCHSLLAKDYEWPTEDEINVTHTHAMNLAKSVHWYVVKSMTRHSDPRPVAMTRGLYEHRDDADRNRNTLGTYTWIDWLELCETFLRHPDGKHSSRPQLPLKQRWWYPVLAGQSFHSLPGYNGVSTGWSPALPHKHKYLSTSDFDQQISDADTLRQRLEDEYNGKPPAPVTPPPPSSPTPAPAGGKVADLQRLLGVDPTGAWNDQTDAAARMHMVKWGSQGPLVEWVQNQLNAHGMESGTADSIAGPVTDGAIRRWQQSQPGLSVDGIAGPKTLRSLAEA